MLSVSSSNVDISQQQQVENMDYEKQPMEIEEEIEVKAPSISAAEYAAMQIQYVKTNQAAIIKNSNKKQREGKTTVTGNFICYQDWKNKKLVQSRIPPKDEDIKSGKTKNDGTYWKLEFKFIMRTQTLNENIRFYKDSTTIYENLCSINYSNKAGEKERVQAYMRENCITPFYDPDTDSFPEKIWYKVDSNMPYKCTLMVYKKSDIDIVKKKDPQTKQFKIRQPQSIDLEGVTAQIYLSLYTKKVKRGDKTEEQLAFRSDFSFNCDRLTPGTSIGNLCTVSDVFHNMYPKDVLFCKDIMNVLKGTEVMPDNAYIWMPSSRQYTANDDSLIRIVANDNDRKSYISTYNESSNIQAKFTITDIYPFKNQTFTLKVTAYTDACKDTGLDTGDMDIWADIMLSHNLSSHLVCTYSSKGTMKTDLNNPAQVAMRSRLDQGQISHGTYVFTVQQWVVDWEKTLFQEGIEITKDCFLRTFKDANASLAKEDRLFYTSKDDDNYVRYNFKSVLEYDNPVVTDGLMSRVIPFGSGVRPTFKCDNATPIIDNTGSRFFALTGVPKSETPEYSTPEEGSDIFEQQLEDFECRYQLFVIQDTSKYIKMDKKKK